MLSGVGAPPLSPDKSAPAEKDCGVQTSPATSEPPSVITTITAPDDSSGDGESADCETGRLEARERPVGSIDGNANGADSKPKELVPAMPLPPGPAEHPCRYTGTLLICAAGQRTPGSVRGAQKPYGVTRG